MPFCSNKSLSQVRKGLELFGVASNNSSHEVEFKADKKDRV